MMNVDMTLAMLIVPEHQYVLTLKDLIAANVHMDMKPLWMLHYAGVSKQWFMYSIYMNEIETMLS